MYLVKALESLAGADSEFANERFNNSANRSYFACFQAAVHALLELGLRPAGHQQWAHDFVQAQFVGSLINRRKLYPERLRDVLLRNLELRHAADYRRDQVSQTQASRALQRAREFVGAIEQEAQ